MDKEKAGTFLLICALVIGATFYWWPHLSTLGQPAASQIAFEQVVRGTHAQVTERLNYRITSSQGIEELWRLLPDAGTPPTIDFETHDVLAVFAGQVPNLSHDITVNTITDQGGKRLVSIVLTKPGQGCVALQAIGTPYEIVVAPKTEFDLTHKDTVVTKDCE